MAPGKRKPESSAISQKILRILFIPFLIRLILGSGSFYAEIIGPHRDDGKRDRQIQMALSRFGARQFCVFQPPARIE